MSQWDKLLLRICSLSKDLSGCRPITIPRHEAIKKVYVEMVKEVVESEAENNENA